MKVCTLIISLIISFVSHGQFRLKRVLKDLSNHPEPINVIDYETRVDKIGFQRQKKNYFLVDFCEARVSEDYNNLEATIESTKGTVSLRRLQGNAKKLLDRWDNSLREKDTLSINKKYPFVIETIRGWYSQIQDSIDAVKDPIDHEQPKADTRNEIIKNLQDSLAKVNYTKEYFNTSRLAEASNSFIDDMEEMQDQSVGGKQISYRMIFERSGPGGTDLVITIEPNFEKHQKYFQKGVYEYLPINDVFEIFSIGVRNKINDSIIVQAWVRGEADGYPLTKENSETYYASMSDVWGVISDTMYSGKHITLSPNEPINNEELAFLRAWNAKYILEKTLERKCVTRIEAIDHSQVDPWKKDDEGTYRNATIKVFLLDYFFTDYKNRIDRPDSNYRDEIIKEVSGK